MGPVHRAKHREGHELRVQAGAEFPGLDAIPGNALDGRLVAQAQFPELFARRGPVTGYPVHVLLDVQLDVGIMPLVSRHLGLDQLLEPVGGRALLLGDPLGEQHDLSDRLAYQGEEDLLLAAVVVIDRGAVRANPLGDVVDAGRVQAFFLEHLGGRG
jgi:hypothetical protein